MWLKFKASTTKETLILVRDKAGLAMLFFMPVVLVFLMTLLQDSTLRMLEERQTPVIVINYDADTFGINVLRGLQEASFFKVYREIDGKIPTEEELQKVVLEGRYRVGIVIHNGASTSLRNRIKKDIQDQFPEEDELFGQAPPEADHFAEVDVYFDPVTKSDFKHAMTSALREFAYAIEARMIFEIYSELLTDIADIELRQNDGFRDMVSFNEQYATGSESRIVPNAVQHNIPAWTIFAMFFIVIPLAGNIIKERESGLALRLKTMPGSNLPVILGKAAVYFFVGLLQAFFMLLIGVFVMPLFGLSALVIDNGIFPILLIIIAVSLAASGYGVLIGTMATSQEQSSIFGSISVVILAAIGGIWVPTFMMSDMMVSVSKLSPLNWGLNAFYEVFLRNAGVADVMVYVLLLFGFFLFCISLAWIYNRHTSR